jgi:hypothetical protein
VVDIFLGAATLRVLHATCPTSGRLFRSAACYIDSSDAFQGLPRAISLSHTLTSVCPCPFPAGFMLCAWHG